MSRVNWANAPKSFETGVDRGVLYPQSGGPVPWVGLTSIDESGADSATTYYMDGRPFLNVPKPKEYTATVKAYTYPDEFSDLMGVVEVADGMYLDSQQSDAFGLCYRTLVGSPDEGTEAGYKIHLIYNATVSPQGNSYESMSDSVNPSEFSWEIQAVPVPIEGYRPTAHVIIDSRHVDQAQLNTIEDLLYGTLTTTGSLPDPAVFYELLNFGSDIIITDLGDGLWSAEGSFDNIEVDADGEFLIRNANAIIHDDDTFTIASTGESLPGSDSISTIISEPL